MSTEGVAGARDFDRWTLEARARALLRSQADALLALEAAVPALVRALEGIAGRLARGGRLVYVDASTSGRLALNDAVELELTFGFDRALVLLAGDASRRASEEAEDDVDEALHALDAANVGEDDAVVGVAASGRTPYTLAAVRETRRRGAFTVGIANNEGAPLLSEAEVGVLLASGPEVIAGSTREDISDLFGTVALGSVTAPNGDTFTYTEDFAWADYGADGCGGFTYDNTATIVETGQYAEATLKVNVQCFIYESAWAEGDDADSFCDNGFRNWGWTNLILPGTYEMDLWAGAAQCDTSKGTLVGSVTVLYDSNGFVMVDYNLFPGFGLEETHVYAGYDMFPTARNGRTTVAPGQYTNNSPFDGRDVYVIAHAVVGMSDPNFGP